MMIQKQYYLNCDACSVIYSDKGEEAGCVRDMAADDGWKVDVNDTELDFCPKCKNSASCTEI